MFSVAMLLVLLLLGMLPVLLWFPLVFLLMVMVIMQMGKNKAMVQVKS